MTIVSRADMQAAVELVFAAMPKRATSAFHDSARLDVGGGKLRITGTDGNAFAASSIEASMDGEWTRCVRTDALNPFVLQGSGDDVSLSLDGNAVILRCAGVRVELPTLNNDAVPDMPEISGRKITAASQHLLEAIERTEFATNITDLSGIRESVWIGCGDAPAAVAATDSYILAVRNVPMDGECPGVLVPRAMCGIVKKLCAMSAGSVSITVSESGTARFDTEGSAVIISTHGTKYCKYTDVMRAAPDKGICVSASELLRALEGCVPFAKNGPDRVRLECRMVGDALKLCVSACGHTGSSFTTGLDADSIGSEGFAVILNRWYLHDAVRGCRTDKVNIYVAGESKPVAVRPHGDEDSYLCVIAPMEFCEWSEEHVSKWFDDAKGAGEK